MRRILLGWLVIFALLCVASLTHQKKILVIRSEGGAFTTVARALADDLSKKSKIEELTLTKETNFQTIKQKIETSKPDLLLLLDNPSVNYAIQYNSTHSSSEEKVRGVALMSLNLSDQLKGNNEISGVTFEPSPYLLLTQFRYIIDQPLAKVLVFYRKSIFHNVIEKSRRLLSAEGIQLIAEDMESNGTDKPSIERRLRTAIPLNLSQGNRFDAVWILLDSTLFNRDTFASIWLPAARDSTLPIITSAENLISPDMHFGAFAVIPNLNDLASQASQQVDSILYKNISPKTFGVEELVSVDKILNLSRSREIKLKLKNDRLADIRSIE